MASYSNIIANTLARIFFTTLRILAQKMLAALTVHQNHLLESHGDARPFDIT